VSEVTQKFYIVLTQTCIYRDEFFPSTMLSAARPFLNAPTASSVARALLSTSSAVSSYRMREERKAAEFFRIPYDEEEPRATRRSTRGRIDDDDRNYDSAFPSSSSSRYAHQNPSFRPPRSYSLDDEIASSTPAASAPTLASDNSKSKPRNRSAKRLELDSLARRIEDRASRELAEQGITPRMPDYLDLLEEQMRHEWRSEKAAGGPSSTRPVPFARKSQWIKDAIKQRELFPEGLCSRAYNVLTLC
jgi:hypothetical protein